ncbi:MAG TPA: hypothetical protein VKJ00_07755, partial [Thermoanaerobaculia bacterium]|nr:hypothetical protein [Thermoanaerobaculia bacterium]
LGGSLTASWLGAVTYVFSGIGVSEAYYTNHHPGVMLLPWIVWAATQSEWSWWRRTLVLSFLFGLDLLAGDVFTIACALLAVFYLIVFESTGPARGREAAALAASLGLAALLALPQLVASALWVPFTDRAVTGMSLNEALRLSIWPLRLLEWIIPYPFGESWRLDAYAGWGIAGRTAGFFPTLYAGAFACIALVALWRSREVGTRLARFCVLAGLALAVPGSLLPAAWKSWRSPIALRHPEKLAVLVVFGLALFAALGWDHFVARGRVVRWPLAVGAILALLALGARLLPSAAGRAAVAISGGEEAVFPIAARQIPTTLAEGGLLWMATVVALAIARRNEASAVLAVALLTAVPIVADRKIGRTFRQEEVLAPTAFARTLMRRDPSGQFRTLALPTTFAPSPWGGQDVEGLEIWRRSWLYFTPALWNRGVVFNQDADYGDLSRVASLRRLATRAAGFSDAQAFFQSVCLRWEIRSRDDPRRAGYRRIGGDPLQEWDELDGASPDLRLLSRWREETTVLAALRALPGLAPGEVVLETGTSRSVTSGGGSLRILERTPERMRLETRASGPTWLYVLRDYFPYRTIRIDGETVEDVPAQLAFSAVSVPAGTHSIEWSEDFPGLALSRWGPVLLIVALLAGWRSRSLMRRKHEGRP